MQEDRLFTDNIDYNIPCWYDNPPGCPNSGHRCKWRCVPYKCMNALINNCGQPNAFKFLIKLVPPKKDVKSFLRLNSIKDDIVNWVNNSSNIFIHSKNNYNGKTTWALKLLYKYFDQVWMYKPFTIMGYYLYIPEFLFKLRDLKYKDTKEFKQIDYILKHCPLVIWDSINTVKLTPNDQVALDIYLNKRGLNGCSNIFVGKTQTQEEGIDTLGILYDKLNSVENIEFLAGSYNR